MTKYKDKIVSYNISSHIRAIAPSVVENNNIGMDFKHGLCMHFPKDTEIFFDSKILYKKNTLLDPW